MKVKHLIEELKKHNPELPVVVYGCEMCMHGVDHLEEETHKPDQGEAVKYVFIALQDGVDLNGN